MEIVMVNANDISRSALLLSPKKAATVLGVSKETLAVWRCTQRYDLPYVKVGRLVRYQLPDIQKFITDRTCNYREVRL